MYNCRQFASIVPVCLDFLPDFNKYVVKIQNDNTNKGTPHPVVDYFISEEIHYV